MEIYKKIRRNKFILILIGSIVISMFVVSEIASRSMPDKSSYQELPANYFSELPSKPDDFIVVQKLRESGILEDNPDKINERYWKQTDWFPNPKQYFDATINSINSLYEPIWCAGIYDAQVIGRIENPLSNENNTVFIQRFWIRSVPGSVKWLGMKIIPEYPQQKTIIGNAKYGVEEMTINQDPSTTSQYIKASVLKICNDSKECSENENFVLGPTLPVLNYEYIKEVWFKIEVDRNIPNGWYAVNLDAVAPDKSFTSDMIWKALDQKFDYTDPNFGNACGVPSFTFFVEVI